MEPNRQLEEVLSWRFVTEFWRRFPKKFILIEAHPCSGQYDCLVLITNTDKPRFGIDVNRGGGSVHVHKDGFDLGDEISLHSDWMDKMLQDAPRFLDEIAQEARLEPPKKLPQSTPTTLVYRFISEFLTHSVGRLGKWECLSGFCDSSGFDVGRRIHLFEKFPDIKLVDRSDAATKLGDHGYDYWFLLKNKEPRLALKNDGKVYRLNGKCYDLAKMYNAERRIWPLIFKTASELLP